jgi:hypothetical protein
MLYEGVSARPTTISLAEIRESVSGQPMSAAGHSRRFDRITATSGLPRRSQPIDATLYLRGKDGVWDGTEIS